MSSFPEKDSQRFGKAFDRSNFTQTCNLLSQFLKEKRSSGNFSLGMDGKTEPRASTVDLLTSMENSENASAVENLPRFVENACIKRSDSRSPESATPQLTIFYSGKVLVFDAFPAEKATEIMELATKLSSDSSCGTKQIPIPLCASSGASEKLNVFKVPQTNTASEAPRPGPQPVGSDMRYPRRSSLVKFLEKRKERVIARGPYQLNNPNPNPKNEEGSSGGDPEDQSSKHLDLNL